MLFSAIILSSTTVIIGCLVVLITESLYNLLYNLPSAPPEMGGLLGQSKNTINTIFVDSGKISFRKSCQYVPNELLLNQTISDWDAQGIIFKGIFHTHRGARMSMLVICGYCLYSINYECLCEKVVFSDCYSSYWSFPLSRSL